jgi:putative two-component system response regulator
MTAPLQHYKVLIVDDSPEIREVLVLTLELERYEVYQAKNGEEALRILQNVKPDLILSDVNMPHMNGIEFFKVLRENQRFDTIPFIFLTGNNLAEDILAGRELGVEDYITKPIAPKDLLAIVHARLARAGQVQVAQVDQAYLETVNVMANVIEGRDPYTHGHVERVADYARLLAEKLYWGNDALRMLEFGARLHDIGKIIVPDTVLKKVGPLTPEEWILMQAHAEAGAKILTPITHLRPTLPYVLYHHERWNGSGYPHGLKETEIPVEGRLLAVVDVFDALTTERPYHAPLPVPEVTTYLQQNMGQLFDPEIVMVFMEVLVETKQIRREQLIPPAASPP